MKKYGGATPFGTKDLLLDECRRKNAIEKKLSALFESRGYREVVTPGVEYYDIFAVASPIPQEEMYKLTESGGRLIVLRPDSTLPIARVVATRMREMPLPVRLRYTQNVFHANRADEGRHNETTQSGVELLGAAGMRADIELLVTALGAFKALGLEGAQIELGHVGFFKALMSEIPFEDGEDEDVRRCVEYKNYAALGDILKKYGDSRTEALGKLPQLFGGEEVLARAEKMTQNLEAKRILEYLGELYGALCGMGYRDSVEIDLGMVHHINYYTGLVFRGYITGSGSTVLTGGRYDGLLSEFGYDIPATGFAINVDQLLEGSAPCSDKESVPEVLVHYEAGCAREAYQLFDRLVSEEKRVLMSVFGEMPDSIAFARAVGIPEIALVGTEGIKTVLICEG